MADKLIVKKIGPIEDAELDIKKITVLIGPQGSGKSTLAKLVAIFNELTIRNSETIKNYIDLYNLQSLSFEKTEINFTSGKEFISLKNKQLDYSPQANSIGDFFEVLEKKNDEFHQFLNTELNIKSLPIYFPAERLLISMISESILGFLSSRIAVPKFIIEFGRMFEIARKQISNLKIDYLAIEYKSESGIDKIYFSDNKNIPLSESASGYQSILPLKLIIEDNYNTDFQKFIIEEPELNLFPITQRHLVNYLVEKCIYNENELFITTHSPYILSSLNLLIFAFKAAQKYPEREAEINAIIPKKHWINPEDFAAYYVADGTVRSIINPKTGMISENELDNVSDLIGDDFNSLMEIYHNPIHEATH